MQANKCRCTVADQSVGLTFGTPEIVLIRVDDMIACFQLRILRGKLSVHASFKVGGS